MPASSSTHQTEHGGTIALGTQGGSYRVQSIGGTAESSEAVEDTILASTPNRTFDPERLLKLEPFDVVIQHEGAVALPDALVKEDWTYTAPLAEDETTPEIHVFEAFITKKQYPQSVAGSRDIRKTTLTVHPTGKGTGLVITAAT